MSRHRFVVVCTFAVLAASASCAAPPGTEVAAHRVVLVDVPGGIAASSQRHGPFGQDGGRSFGFSHDDVGAAVAATHIGARTSPGAGTDVIEATLLAQSWGDRATARAQLVAPLPVPDQPARPDLTPTAIYFRVIAGDARGDHVVVSLLADTAQARSRGGYSRVDTTLRREHGDWRLRVPVSRPSTHPDTTGYTLLGPTP